MKRQKKSNKTVAIIPARGGSKSISHKNIVRLAGKPLIHYTIETCLTTPEVDAVYVSTESTDIRQAVQAYPDVGLIDRPMALAGDRIVSEDVLVHAIQYLQKKGVFFDLVLFAQATSPLTLPYDFSALIRSVGNENNDSAAFFVEDYGYYFGEDDMTAPRLPRQVRKPRKKEAGNGWVFKVKTFLECKSRLHGKIGLCPIEYPRNLEVDDENDIIIVERLLQLSERKKQNLYYKKRSKNDVGGNDVDGYWGVVVDPDGVKRDRMLEKEQRKKDVETEVNYINRLPVGRILDVGCGMGDLLSAVESSWEKYGLEISSVAAKEASKHAIIHEGELTDDIYEKEFFDVVLLHHVIEHFDQPEIQISRIRRLLKLNGILIVGTPDFDGAMARRFKERYRLLNDKTHVSLFSRISLRHFLEDNGFEIRNESFPYFNTRFFTEKNLLKLFDVEGVSPPFWGSFMTFYCRKKY